MTLIRLGTVTEEVTVYLRESTSTWFYPEHGGPVSGSRNAIYLPVKEFGVRSTRPTELKLNKTAHFYLLSKPFKVASQASPSRGV
jgi:hypothetical protein